MVDDGFSNEIFSDRVGAQLIFSRPDVLTASSQTHWAKRCVVLLNFALVLASTLVGFGVVELAARAFGFHGANNFEIQNTVLVDDPVLNWRYKPNSISYFNKIVYQINERGFRDDLYAYAKPEKTYRIFLASDSVGFGTNVQVHDSYPKILERKLNDIAQPLRVEVINHSMPGLSIKQKLHLVELYAQKYSPDLIIVDFVPNDVEFESTKDPEREKEEKCFFALIHLEIPCDLKMYAKRSAFLFLVKEAFESGLHRLNIEDKNHYYEQVESDFYHRIYAKPETYTYLKTVFRNLKTYQNEHGIPILMPIFPLIYDYTKYKWDDLDKLVASLCDENKILHVSLLQDFRKFSYNDMRVQRGDFTHPSVKGNTIAAQAIAKTILDHGFLGNGVKAH